ncbi:MAG: hypothetical protein JWO86_356 [Myxococcaceae bacterium]|nr:hypothetical protein [Myxococcaceae bacterium]
MTDVDSITNRRASIARRARTGSGLLALPRSLTEIAVSERVDRDGADGAHASGGSTMTTTTTARRSAATLGCLVLLLAACAGESAGTLDTAIDTKASPLVTDPIRFAVTGDFGGATVAEGDVANLVRSWAPDFVITTGDNNYPDGAASTIDANIGQFYHSFIFPYTGAYGAGADVNRFFPSLGNHDWVTSGAVPYLTYFQLPGNERYYDFVRGPVHFFAVDSDPSEPDGTSPTSVQGTWLKNALAAATEPWKIVYFHHAPFSSGTGNGPSPWMRWPFQQWGATAVLTGHEHDYERILLDGLPYFVNGLGGEETYPFTTPIPGSIARYTGEYGAMLVQGNSTSLQFQFFNRNNVLIDTYTLPGTPALTMSSRLISESGPVNGVVDPGERVTVGLALTNGGGSSTNLVGTLAANAGVSAPSAPQTYGAILGGNTVERTFSFTAAGSGGATITAALQLQDGANNLGTLSTTFVLASGNSFANTNSIGIPAMGIASPYASKITVSGQPTNPNKVTVTLRGVNHTYGDDIDVLLVGPGGQKMVLMSDVGGSTGLVDATLTFDDAAATKLADASAITSGTYKPTDFGTGDTFPGPAPGAPYAATLAAFNGVSPNGDWSLYVLDDEAGDSGSITGGWSLSFSYPAITPPTDPTIALTAPAAGASFVAPATINLAADVAANGHTVSTVEFFSGATLLGADTTAPYSFVWTGVATGSYAVTARATYDTGSVVTPAATNVTVSAGGGGNPNPANTAAFTIPGIGVASLYPSQIVVSGLAVNPSKVTVTISGISHTYADDIDAVLVGPGGQSVVLMSDVGGSKPLNNLTLTFDDLAAAKLADSTQLSAGTFKPTDFVTGDKFPSPAPVGPYGATLSAFTGKNPNGTWSLYVLDDEANDSGSIAGGWGLHFTYP